MCNLGSINLAQHVSRSTTTARPAFDFDKLAETVRVAVRQLDRVIDLNFYPIETARRSNLRWRPVGLGVMGLQDVFFKLRLPFDSAEALQLSTTDRRAHLLPRAGGVLRAGEQHGAHPSFADTRAATGALQFDLWGVAPTETAALGRPAAAHRRARPAQLAADRDRADRDHRLDRRLLRVHRAAGVQPVQARDAVGRLPAGQPLPGRGTQEARPVDRGTRDRSSSRKARSRASTRFPTRCKAVYRTAWELPLSALIDMAAERGAVIDQCQSLNLFMESPNIGQSVVDVHVRVEVGTEDHLLPALAAGDEDRQDHGQRRGAAAYSRSHAGEAVACSLENPEACEACQ